MRDGSLASRSLAPMIDCPSCSRLAARVRPGRSLACPDCGAELVGHAAPEPVVRVALPRTLPVAPTPAPEPPLAAGGAYVHPVPRAPSGDPWRAFVADVLALAGADLSRALPLGGVQPGGGGGEPGELLARVARGDVARARAALRRLAGCSPAVVAGLAEVLTPGITQDEAAGRYAAHHAPLALRDAVARAEERERTARHALEVARTARRGHARRSLVDPARESVARLVEDRARAHEEAHGAVHGARGRLLTWGLTVVAGELARYTGA